MIFKHDGRTELVQTLNEKRIILFGASIQPQEMWRDILLNYQYDISLRIDFLVDNDEEKWDSQYSISNMSYLVKSPEALKEIDWSEHILIITSRFYLDIIGQIEEMSELSEAEVYAWPCVTLDREKTVDDKYEIRIRQEALTQYEFWLGNTGYAEITKNDLRQKMRNKVCKEGYRVIPRVTVMHSDVCSLHCTNCCDLIPQVKRHYYIPAKEIIENLDLLLSGVDMCMSLDLTDGEGLLYREIDELIEYAVNNPKIATVLLISNGTIVPKESTLKLMQHPKFWIAISDYDIPDKTGSVIDEIKKNRINLAIQRDFVWKDLKVNDIEKRTEGRDMLRYEFLRCRNKLCSKALFGKKLYACMPAFRMANLGIYESDKDYIELNETDSPDQIWDKLYHICMLEYIEACDYCNFENTGVDIIPVGS